jgi:hypothetical protein
MSRINFLLNSWDHGERPKRYVPCRHSYLVSQWKVSLSTTKMLPPGFNLWKASPKFCASPIVQPPQTGPASWDGLLSSPKRSHQPWLRGTCEQPNLPFRKGKPLPTQRRIQCLTPSTVKAVAVPSICFWNASLKFRASPNFDRLQPHQSIFINLGMMELMSNGSQFLLAKKGSFLSFRGGYYPLPHLFHCHCSGCLAFMVIVDRYLLWGIFFILEGTPAAVVTKYLNQKDYRNHNAPTKGQRQGNRGCWPVAASE